MFLLSPALVPARVPLLAAVLAAAIMALGMLISMPAQGASYQQLDGTIVDPIQLTDTFGGGAHPYAGPNLAPGTNASGANLSDAVLTAANLVNAILQNANFSDADLFGADFGSADLTHARLGVADLTGASLAGATLADADFFAAFLQSTDFSGAVLTNAVGLGFTSGSAQYDALTDFTNAFADNGTTLFDPVAAGWTLIPEPSAALLMGLGLLGLTSRSRAA